MGEVIDVRPDRFLKELREHADPDKACAAARMSREELNAIILSNPKFDLARVECVLEFTEDLMTASLRGALAQLRAAALEKFKERHPGGESHG